MNSNFQNLPPELQERINNIVNQAAAQPAQPAQQTPVPPAPPEKAAAPVVRPPSLMDHVIALRQEVAELRQQVNAVGQVSEAVGNAVGSMYAMFQEQTQPSSFSSNFQAPQSQVEDEGYDQPFRIQTPSGFRKYLCSGLYLPSVTTVLSATESEKSKASLRTWQKNNPGALEEASTRGSAIHKCCEDHTVVYLLIALMSINLLEWHSNAVGLMRYWSERPLHLIGITSE